MTSELKTFEVHREKFEMDDFVLCVSFKFEKGTCGTCKHKEYITCNWAQTFKEDMNSKEVSNALRELADKIDTYFEEQEQKL